MPVWSQKVFVSTFATNGIKRHLAIDTIGFPFFTHCTRANFSDDTGLIEMFTFNIDYFKSKPIDIPSYHHPARARVSPRIFDSGVRADLPGDHEQNPVSTFSETLKTRESSARKMWICSGSSQMGDRALQRARWNLVKFWLRTLNEPWLMPGPNSTSAPDG
jgi:hypothetical protein